MLTLMKFLELLIKMGMSYQAADISDLTKTYIEFVFFVVGLTYLFTKKIVKAKKYLVKIYIAKATNYIGKRICKLGKKIVEKSMLF